jgi:hypothetical protein
MQKVQGPWQAHSFLRINNKENCLRLARSESTAHGNHAITLLNSKIMQNPTKIGGHRVEMRMPRQWLSKLALAYFALGHRTGNDETDHHDTQTQVERGRDD